MDKSLYGKIIVIVLLIVSIGLIYSGRKGLAPHDLTGQGTSAEDINMAPINIAIASQMIEQDFSIDDDVIEVDQGVFERILQSDYDYEADLFDVTENQDFNAHRTGGMAKGKVKTIFTDGEFRLYGTFDKLPEAKKDFFYEGWIVRKEPFEFISTGPAVQIEGKYTNAYASTRDLLDYDFYVLTLEPNDADPAPAVHFLEGDIQLMNNNDL